ncbi:large subunit GTPase 1 homolog [Zophobas morio]|uniref:large subunit GTPase 1 homolog n=1 Tax=Zophobas morio TaxID=2755281 RepID=UPI0030839A1A
MTNKKRSCLGKSLIRDRFRKSEVPRLPFNVYDNELTFEPNLESVTTTSDIATLLESAQLLAEKYTVENDGVMLVDSSFATSLEQGEQLQCSKNSQLLLTIPRRPKWTKQTNSQLLLELERKEFLNWRRQLAFIQKDVLLLTPYERNLEVWRQLWRVIEKSHVVVQLVDARNPLLFYCADLFRYVKEIDPLKKNILLINKADLLTKAQRFYWTTYFENNQVEHAFWSALQCTQDEDFKDSQGINIIIVIALVVS